MDFRILTRRVKGECRACGEVMRATIEDGTELQFCTVCDAYVLPIWKEYTPGVRPIRVPTAHSTPSG